MLFSGKKIKTPGQGLLAMHPFVDVLEGRDLMTATALGGVLTVTQFADGPAVAQPMSPWAGANARDEVVTAVTPAAALAIQTTPGVYTLQTGTDASSFSERVIGDTGWTLFGNALHDRRQSQFEPKLLPTDEQIAAARQSATGESAEANNAFADGRSLTGAMRPFFCMHADQVNHPFADELPTVFAQAA